MTVKTENQIWADVFQILNGILETKNITGWKIRQGNQPTMEGLKNGSVYITRIGSRRYGWQAHKSVWNETEGKMIQQEQYFQEVLFQISAFKKRNPADITEMTSGDLLNSFITFLQSIAGVKALQSLGYQTFRIQELREPTISNDSDLYEKLPSFDISLILVQNEECETGHTDKLNLTKMKGI